MLSPHPSKSTASTRALRASKNLIRKLKSTRHPATNRVLNSPELLELILLHLPVKDLLTRIPAVCKHWRSLHKSSINIQRALFLAPFPADHLPVRINPFFRNLAPLHLRRGLPLGETHPNDPGLKAARTTMPLTSPPTPLLSEGQTYLVNAIWPVSGLPRHEQEIYGKYWEGTLTAEQFLARAHVVAGFLDGWDHTLSIKAWCLFVPEGWRQYGPESTGWEVIHGL